MNSKKRVSSKAIHESKAAIGGTELIETNITYENKSCIPKNLKQNKTPAFKSWCFGTINIRSGKEKDEGAKIYSITKHSQGRFNFLLPPRSQI